MPLAPIVLLETDYETLDDALAKPLVTRIASKDAQTTELTAQGIPFQQHILYRLTDGACVFLIIPIDPELESEQPSRASSKPRTRRTSPQKRRERTRQVDYR